MKPLTVQQIKQALNGRALTPLPKRAPTMLPLRTAIARCEPAAPLASVIASRWALPKIV